MTLTPSASRPDRPLRIAIIGAGPAGVYTADILTKEERDFRVSIDLFDRYPAPFGLIRYGVARTTRASRASSPPCTRSWTAGTSVSSGTWTTART